MLGEGARKVRALVAGAVVALLLGECAARRVSFAPRTLDPDLGFVIAGGAEVHYQMEGSATSHWAADGVRRDPLAPLPHEPAEHAGAILVVGDSQTEAKEVSDEEVYSSRAAALLRASGFDKPVLNLGIEGQRTPIYVANAPIYMRRFAPSWTVVTINDDDLMQDMFVENASYFSGGRDGTPLELHVVPLGRGAGGLRTRYRQLRARSALVQLGVRQADGFGHELRASHLFHATAPAPAAPPRASEFPIAAALTKLFEAYDKRMTLLYISSFDPEHADEPSDVEAEVVRYCTESRTSCVFARAAWPEFVARHGTPFGFPNGQWNFGHPNAEGHRALGQLLADELLSLRRRGLL